MASVLLHPNRHRAVIFDLDGVVTDTAAIHFRAWKRLFDQFLDERPARAQEDHRPFSEEDSREYVDGKPRREGVTSFLASRGIELPDGDADDPEDRNTVHGPGCGRAPRTTSPSSWASTATADRAGSSTAEQTSSSPTSRT